MLMQDDPANVRAPRALGILEGIVESYLNFIQNISPQWYPLLLTRLPAIRAARGHAVSVLISCPMFKTGIHSDAIKHDHTSLHSGQEGRPVDTHPKSTPSDCMGLMLYELRNRHALLPSTSVYLQQQVHGSNTADGAKQQQTSWPWANSSSAAA